MPDGHTPTSRVPKRTNRRIRDYAIEIDAHRQHLLSLRARIVEDLEEAEAEVQALRAQVRDIDRTLHIVPEGA